MKKLYLVCITFFLWNNICAQNTGDTIIIQTFIHDAWTDGNGNSTGSGARDTIAYFPTDTNITFEKIIMSYNMRCKDNNNNNPGPTSTWGGGQTISNPAKTTTAIRDVSSVAPQLYWCRKKSQFIPLK